MFISISKKTAKKTAKGIALGFGSGLSPKAPGTCGTLCIYLITMAYIFVFDAPAPALRAGIALLTVLTGLLVTWMILDDYPEKIRKDPQEIVIDEFAGYLVTVAVVPWTPLYLTLGFILFRIFDITKAGPIKSVEKLPGTWGIILDDVAAGIIAALILFITACFV
jgi:phosphatidylglycerophosphatase A